MSTTLRRARTAPAAAPLMVLTGSVSVQFGSALAALTFPRAGVAGVVTLRLVLATVVLLALARPRLSGRSRSDWLVAGGFGLSLGAMNTLIYQAIERIPLGAAVTLEFLGPLVLSLAGARRAASWLWALVAAAGVVLLGRNGFHGLDPAGVGLALGSATMWACYILLSARTGARFARLDGLALAMTVAALLTLPAGLLGAGRALLDPLTLALGAGVALLSSVLPYALELMALRRMAAGVFAVLMSLGPALAALAGWLVLGQRLGLVELVAIGLVVVAGVGVVRSSAGPPAPTVVAD